MSNAIPAAPRMKVVDRDRVCQRCGLNGAHVHHRRSRSIRDEHTHCPCNMLYLCFSCHGWAHAHPAEARLKGYILSRWTPHPQTIGVDSYMGTIHTFCDGSVAIHMNGEIREL